MKYFGMPLGMWVLFVRSFKNNMNDVLNISTKDASIITRKAKRKYKRIIAKLPEFERSDRFKMNIVNCAMLAAFYLNMQEKPPLDKMTEYYRRSMMTGVMKWFCRQSGKKKFSPQDIASMKETAKLKAADLNPYSWNMDFYEYEDGSGYEARFTKCGICTLMKELEIFEVVPAMCRLDYAMSEAGGASDFVREYTLANGGDYCDCGYKRKALYSKRQMKMPICSKRKM